jgi:ubiquinone/menaquinone biosynthesis C-methylase UbiE
MTPISKIRKKSNLMWQKENLIQFWEGNKAEYAGDVSSPEIIRLSKGHIGKRVLDAGAGSGALINLIPNATGLDLVAKHPKIIQGDISNMPFENDSFETVFATEILEHLDDETLTKGINEIYRVLCKRGSFIITVPYKENLNQDTVICPKCGIKFHRWGHIQVFDENRLEEILKKKGFDVIRMKPLPIGFMASHRFIKYFRYLIKKLGFLSSLNLFAIAVKR